MAILSSLGVLSKTFLTTLAGLGVFPTTESIVGGEMNARLPQIASKPTTKPLVEMEPLLHEKNASFFEESHAMYKRSEADGPEELPIHAQSTRAANVRQVPGAEDAFYSYLRDIRGLGLLTADEEIDLARQIAAGSKLARRILIESNVRLVIAIARRYVGSGVPLIDLIQEGNLGLMRAAEKFDYQRGCHFSSYATWWIRQAVRRAAGDQSRLIHLPLNVTTRLQKVRRVSAQLSQEFGLDPLPGHIAEACNMNLDEVIKLLGIVEQPVSLDAPVDEEARYTLADTLEDTLTPAPAETASRHVLGEELQRALTLLTPRERSTIILRYGIGDGHSRTLLEVGEKLGISRERVRQLEAAALKKIRSHLGYE